LSRCEWIAGLAVLAKDILWRSTVTCILAPPQAPTRTIVSGYKRCESLFTSPRSLPMKKPFLLHRCLLAAVALTASCIPAWAQGNIRTVLFVKVKLGQEENWKAVVKDYAATVKKAGSEQGFTVCGEAGSLTPIVIYLDYLRAAVDTGSHDRNG
jgi:hypothetical protein